ncbi:hypothetical protein OPKNFCMD_3128 [Methylobacterium crusticola]|uniref:DUF4126 domain-containing protein n=1 Tax=Methylobacterium crusticola TaxID=1697972 RepID=A0ABQ4R0I4_9HYPH|nr:hypothetical protein [Methylobacterium crusticola]GJD50389.1 hypothetical protein OPKNFCMD_3128 [Methylobacterium crusticola]
MAGAPISATGCSIAVRPGSAGSVQGSLSKPAGGPGRPHGARQEQAVREDRGLGPAGPGEPAQHLGLALATRLLASRFSAPEREAGGGAAVLGAAFITEGAIPFAAADPLLPIPNAVTHVAGARAALAVGTAVTALRAGLLKRRAA